MTVSVKKTYKRMTYYHFGEAASRNYSWRKRLIIALIAVCFSIVLIDGNVTPWRAESRTQTPAIMMLAAIPQRRVKREGSATVLGVDTVSLDAVQYGIAGFTLIELSIVLVVIGLVVGGVLVGRDLISAAAVRAQINQIERYQQAVNTFRGKLDALPGDLNAQAASTFGFSPRGQYAGEGDGNGVIQGVSVNGPGANFGFVAGAGEPLMFWVDLTTANGLNLNLIDGSFNSGTSSTTDFGINGSRVAKYFPSAKMTPNSIYAYSGSGAGGIGLPINYFGLSNLSGILPAACSMCIYSTPGLSVQQAYVMDKKVDDGLPTSGNVIVQYADGNAFEGIGYGNSPNAASSSGTTCYDTTSSQYSITQNNGSGMNCALSFKFQ